MFIKVLSLSLYNNRMHYNHPPYCYSLYIDMLTRISTCSMLFFNNSLFIEICGFIFFQIRKNINGQEISWALGAMVNVIEQFEIQSR